jgi:hypothetical protein
MFVAVLAATALAVAFEPRAKHRALDPDEPIAADGSMTAGRARTIYDTNPILRADAEAPRPDPDDPRDFEDRIEIEKWTNDHARQQMADVLGPLNTSRCESAAHSQLMAAVYRYYDIRGRDKHSFSMRGPRATAAIEKVWSTPVDLQIDEFVRQALQSGFLHKAEVLRHYLPEFTKTFAETKEIGDACPLTKTADGDPSSKIPLHPDEP